MQNESLREHIGQRVEALRKEKKLRQEDLGSFMGMTRTSIINIEKGRQGLTPESLYDLCCALHCTPNDLFPEIKPAQYKETKQRMVRVKVKTRLLPKKK